RLGDRVGCDHDDALIAIGPGRRLPCDEIVSSASHHHGSDALDENTIIVLAEIRAIIFEQPIEIVILGGDHPVEAGGDISQDPGHDVSPLINKRTYVYIETWRDTRRFPTSKCSTPSSKRSWRQAPAA